MGSKPLPAHGQLTDAEIRAIADRISRATAVPPPGDPRDDICARRHQLPPQDEARVIAVLEAPREARRPRG